MRSATPKVLHPLGGRPLILHVVAAAVGAGTGRPLVVVSPDQPEVADVLDGQADTVEQPRALGTGDALRSVPDGLRSQGSVLVLSADVPLIRAATLRRLIDRHADSEAACTLLSVIPDDPAGLGRILRDERGQVQRIVEERDLRDTIGAQTECNAGVYVFDGSALWPALSRLHTDNAQQEYYLTDVIELLGGPVQAMQLDDPREAMGINDRRQLSTAEDTVRRRVLDALMLAGVTIRDPDTTYVDATAQIGADTFIEPLCVIRGDTVIGSGCSIGPMAQLRDVRAGDRVTIGSSHLEECELGEGVTIGSYDRVRPNTVLGPGVELGTHAEVKNSTIGADTRIGHFSCVLDSDVGKNVNIGAGTVTCNYDGSGKHRTTIEDGVFVGSNATLVAPVRLGAGSYIGAGSFIDTDVPAGALAVGRTRQRNIDGWAARRKEDRG
jgi:bifunctional UDP-N-acetylglucosamine pyrophosphorylase / glucosamine-1-phosphate N-acetyltransferase